MPMLKIERQFHICLVSYSYGVHEIIGMADSIDVDLACDDEQFGESSLSELLKK